MVFFKKHMSDNMYYVKTRWFYVGLLVIIRNGLIFAFILVEIFILIGVL